MTLLSIVLAFLVLRSALSWVYYLVLTLVLMGIVLALKMRFLRTGVPQVGQERLPEADSQARGWRSLLTLFGLLIAVMLLPLLLARFHPEGWFVGLISYTSGVSGAEVVFFFITRRS